MRPRQRLDPREAYRWKGYIVRYASRERIRELIAMHPGISTSSIKLEVDLPWDVVRHHLHELVRLGKVGVARPERKTKRYFVMEKALFLDDLSDLYQVELSGFNWKPHMVEFIALLLTRDLWRRVEILHETMKMGWKRSTTHYRLRKLVRFGVVERGRRTSDEAIVYKVVEFHPLTGMQLMVQWPQPGDEERSARRMRRTEGVRKASLASERQARAIRKKEREEFQASKAKSLGQSGILNRRSKAMKSVLPTDTKPRRS